MSIRSLGAAFVISAAAGWAVEARAQVETIDPNPTMPRDVGGRLTYRGFSSGGARLGRSARNEENPAETLLRSIEGTNYGRATGHSIFSQRGSRSLDGKNIRQQARRSDRGATLFYAQRGAYEDRVYQPGRGSYRPADPQHTYYRPQPTRSIHRQSPETMPKRDGNHTARRIP